jgi:hypothetical protein
MDKLKVDKAQKAESVNAVKVVIRKLDKIETTGFCTQGG